MVKIGAKVKTEIFELEANVLKKLKERGAKRLDQLRRQLRASQDMINARKSASDADNQKVVEKEMKVLERCTKVLSAQIADANLHAQK